jgi:hypothetical protein
VIVPLGEEVPDASSGRGPETCRFVRVLAIRRAVWSPAGRTAISGRQWSNRPPGGCACSTSSPEVPPRREREAPSTCETCDNPVGYHHVRWAAAATISEVRVSAHRLPARPNVGGVLVAGSLDVYGPTLPERYAETS